MITSKRSIFVLLMIVGAAQAKDIKEVNPSVLAGLAILQKAEVGDLPSIIRIFAKAVHDRNEEIATLWLSRMTIRLTQDCSCINFDTNKLMDTVLNSISTDFSTREEKDFIVKISESAQLNTAAQWASKIKTLPEPTWVVAQLAKEGMDFSGLVMPKDKCVKNRKLILEILKKSTEQ